MQARNYCDFLFGRPLATSQEHAAHIGVSVGIPIFGLDGLTSAAYGPEQTMSLLIPLGLLGMQHYLLPIFSAILTLLVILYFSYRQTIAAYPNGGGSYTVASENLGDTAGLFAAAALMIDSILTAAVGGSAGVTALVSAIPALHRHQLLLCRLILGNHCGREHARGEGVRIRLHAADVPVCGDAAGDGGGWRRTMRLPRAGTR